MTSKRILATLVAATVLLAAGAAQAVVIDTVPVGNAGNAADTTGYGSVAYTYNIGKYEVTAGQYTAFLNAVAATDTYALYNTVHVGHRLRQRDHAKRHRRAATPTPWPAPSSTGR